MTARYFRKYSILIVIFFLLAGCKEPITDSTFDFQIEDLKLVKLLTGDEAIGAVNRLHGTSIDMVCAYIAHYKGIHDKASIWVSEAPSEQIAIEQIELMINKMKSNKRSPFSNYRTVKKKGRTIIAFNGIGQVHYVFRDNAWAYWISADEKRMDDILEYLSRYR